MSQTLPLLFLSFTLYGSFFLALSYYSLASLLGRLLLGFLLLNLIVVCGYLSLPMSWVMRSNVLFFDSLSIFVVCMGALSYALTPGAVMRSPAFQLIMLSFATAIFAAGIYFFLYFTYAWHLFIYDPLLYRIDASLGFSPSAWLALYFWRFQGLSYFVYAALPLAFFVVCGRAYRQTQSLPWSLIGQCFIAGVAAWFLYNLLPACGPVHAFPDLWPKHVVPLTKDTMLLHKFVPRNCVPSLHMAWIYLIWRYVCSDKYRGYATSKFRWLMTGWLILVALSTLTTGEHYLIDLLFGVIFAVTVRAIYPVMHMSFLFSMGLYLFWLCLILKAPYLLMQHFWLNVGCWLGSLLLLTLIEFRVSAVSTGNGCRSRPQ